MNKLKSRHLQDLVSVEDSAVFVHMAIISWYEESSDVQVQWAEGDGEEEDDSDVVYFATEDAKGLEGALSSTSFIHGMAIGSDLPSALAVMNTQVQVGTRLRWQFWLRIPINHSVPKKLRSISGSGTVLWQTRIHISFHQLGIVIDFNF